MKRSIAVFSAVICCFMAAAQVPGIDYNPGIQPAGNIQYFAPEGDNLFVGDCIPFYHDGTYYLYWLLDRGHHSSLNGLGAHQWCLSTSRDLRKWKHYPVVIGIDEEWEKSICTGSVAYHKGKFYAFYATRRLDGGQVKEQLSYAVSDDGIHFRKHKPNPFYTFAPGYSQRHFRDPKVSVDPDGTFHLFVASTSTTSAIPEYSGCLVHLSSRDLQNWTVGEPLISGQRDVPECPDYFEWNGWWYIVYGIGGDTYYMKSRSPYGPWIYPSSQALVESWVNVAKTAPFGDGRRIIAGWIPSRDQDNDHGGERFGGNVVLREAVQLENGDLGTKFPEEAEFSSTGIMEFKLEGRENVSSVSRNGFTAEAQGSIADALVRDVPRDCRITFEIVPEGNYEECGIRFGKGYRMTLCPDRKRVSLWDSSLDDVDGLSSPLKVEVVMKGSIVDACIGERRCIVNRIPRREGGDVWFFARGGKVSFRDIKIEIL